MRPIGRAVPSAILPTKHERLCHFRLLYGVYAEVAKHRTWIDEKIAALHNFLRFPMKLLYQSVTSLTSFDKMIIEVKSRKIV